jgi:hypothetical protein
MIILDATTKSLEIKLAGAITTNQLPWTVAYVDYLDSDQSVSDIAGNDGATNNTTAVTMVAAPAASHTRHVKRITVWNKDTAAATVTVQLNDNGTARELYKITLAVGDNLVDDPES